MKRVIVSICVVMAFCGAVMAACPSFPGVMYGSLTYNYGSVPWPLEFYNEGQMSGNLDGASFQWYRYREGQPESSATKCGWQTDFSTCTGFLPATDEPDSRYIYYCQVTTNSCPEGAKSGLFTVVIGSATECPTFSGVNFSITNGGSYSSGQDLTITATTNAYGGEHVYTWYHNGEELDPEDPRYTFVWGFQNPQLIIENIQPEDGGTYSISMKDGTTCILYTDPVRILVDEPDCGPNPTLTITGKNSLCEGEGTTVSLTNNELSSGEEGKLEYMLQPEGSHPTSDISNGVSTWSADKAGVYQFKYVVDNPANPSCFRESKVVSVTVYSGGEEVTIAPSADIMKYGEQLTFTCSAPGEGEEGKITWTNEQGQSGDIWPNTYPDFAHTNWNAGTYTYTYTVTNTAAGCKRTAQCTVLWYQCEWGAPQWGKWYPDQPTVKVNTEIDLKPSKPTVNGMTCVFTYSLDGGAPVEIDPTMPFTPTAPGTYVFTYAYKHSDPRVTDCYSEISKTFIVEPCGTKAELSTDKEELLLGESATLTMSAVESGETAELSYKKDGGTEIPLAISTASYTFSPTEPGTYVFTYSITATDCEASSASVTIEVSGCAPAPKPSVEPSATRIQCGEELTFTCSAPGEGETGKITWTNDKGQSGDIDQNTYPNFAHSCSVPGTYTYTYTVSNPHVDCPKVSQCVVVWYQCETPYWGNLYEDGTTVALNTPIDLQPSQPTMTGVKGVLTYSLDGGSPVEISATVPFTPTATGTYVFTYVYQPSGSGEISCESDPITKTIIVGECSTASISTAKTTIALGETVPLTLSPTGDNEKAALTFSKDGGPEQAVMGLSFTPDEEGTYVITYTVLHDILECSSSDQVTVTVLSCGPEAKVTLSLSTVAVGESVSITLSEPGQNEQGKLTVQSPNGSISVLTANSFTPTAEGEYVFTYTITHESIDCERSAKATLTVTTAEIVFDDHNGTHQWSDPKNWWPHYDRLPEEPDSVIIRGTCNVDIDNAVAQDLTFDGGTITISPTGALVVLNQLLHTTPSSITIESSEKGCGALVMGPKNNNIPATVQFYSAAKNMGQIYPVWQYMGSPLQEQLLICNAYPQAMLFEWTNTPSAEYGANWQRIDSLNGNVTPFTGYCLTQKKERTYTLQGTLNNPAVRSVNVPFNDQGAYPGFAFVANSWVAPIDISALDESDFGAADATVYIMNAGTYNQAVQQQDNASTNGTGAAAGQYNTIPVHAAFYLPNALSVIPPMQGFFVHTNAATSLNLDYSKAVYTPALTKVSTTPLRAPLRMNDERVPDLLHLRVSGFGHEDEVVLIESPEFTPAFDNGWDGRKARSERSDISMAVVSEDGPMAVAALPQIEGTEISFEGGNHKTYQINVQGTKVDRKKGNGNPLCLRDMENDEYTELTEGASYTFKCGPEPKRFVITRLTNDERTNDPKATKFLQNGLLYIRIGERIYDATGRLLTQ